MVDTENRPPQPLNTTNKNLNACLNPMLPRTRYLHCPQCIGVHMREINSWSLEGLTGARFRTNEPTFQLVAGMSISNQTQMLTMPRSPTSIETQLSIIMLRDKLSVCVHCECALNACKMP